VKRKRRSNTYRDLRATSKKKSSSSQDEEKLIIIIFLVSVDLGSTRVYDLLFFYFSFVLFCFVSFYFLWLVAWAIISVKTQGMLLQCFYFK
jgi:hypothetical protein